MNTEHSQEWNQTKQNEIRMREIIQKMIQNTYERNDILSHLKQNFENQDLYIRDLLNKETNQLVVEQPSNLILTVPSDSQNKHFTRIVEWWNFHIINAEGSTIRSSIIWTMFKRDNPDLIGEITAIEFKDVLYSFLSEDRIVKPRNKAGALEIKNIRWKIDRTMNIS
jgi:LEA14-like dessication related protein